MLTDLTLSRNYVGLYLNGHVAAVGSPLELSRYVSGAGAITDISDCGDSNIKLAAVQNVRLSGLTLDSTSYGLDASATTNRNVTVEDVDTTPHRFGGYGLYLAGADHDVLGVSSTLRNIGVLASAASNLTVDGLSARRGVTGLYLQSVPNTPASFSPPTLSDLELTDNTRSIAVARRATSTPSS